MSTLFVPHFFYSEKWINGVMNFGKKIFVQQASLKFVYLSNVGHRWLHVYKACRTDKDYPIILFRLWCWQGWRVAVLQPWQYIGSASSTPVQFREFTGSFNRFSASSFYSSAHSVSVWVCVREFVYVRVLSFFSTDLFNYICQCKFLLRLCMCLTLLDCLFMLMKAHIWGRNL